ncbi:MAG TPA: hypothetical protein VLV83_22065 [Acidobacteriota bacterium]|nr:hypothetical protein [Acidobacteriota bacterium]
MRSFAARQELTRRAGPIVLALILTELFFKLHSFTLELAAFLATAYAIDWVFEALRQLHRRYLARV